MKNIIVISSCLLFFLGCSLNETINKNIDYTGVYYTSIFIDFDSSDGVDPISPYSPVIIVNGETIDTSNYDFSTNDTGYCTLKFDRTEDDYTFKAGNSYALNITFPAQTVDEVTYEEYELNLTVEIPLYREYMYLGRQTIVFTENTP